MRAFRGLKNSPTDKSQVSYKKIQEILYKMVTEIFQFGPWEAEIIGFKEGWGLKSISGPRDFSKLGRPLQT